MSAAIRARSIGVSRKRSRLLDEIDLDIATGEWVSIVGPNGAGKSTLLKALAGVIDSQGSVELMSHDLADTRGRERARLVSWVPQAPTIPPGMRVLDYVLLGRTPHLHPLASESAYDLDLAWSVLAELDLADLAARMVDTLSGGELQRAVIGRALVQEAPIILFDEPTSALDLGHQQDVLMLLDRLRADRSRTIVTTMHDLTLAGHFADRIVLLADGRIVAQGSARDVLTEHNLRRHYRAEVEVRDERGIVVVVPRIDRPEPTTTLERPQWQPNP